MTVITFRQLQRMNVKEIIIELKEGEAIITVDSQPKFAIRLLDSQPENCDSQPETEYLEYDIPINEECFNSKPTE